YEDREGNLWVTTDRGVDMFYDTSIVTYSSVEGLVGAALSSVLALRDGTVWVCNEQALNIMDRNGIRAVDSRHALPGQDVGGLFEGSVGRLWVGVGNTVTTYERGRFSLISGAEGQPLVRAGNATAFAEDRNGDIWALTIAIAPDQHHLLRIRDRRVVE